MDGGVIVDREGTDKLGFVEPKGSLAEGAVSEAD